MPIKKYFFEYTSNASLVKKYLINQVDPSTPPQAVSIGQDGIEVEIDDSAIEDVTSALVNRFDVSYYGEMTGNSYKSKGDFSERPDASELPDGVKYFAKDTNTNYHVNSGEWKQDEAVEWALSTPIFTAPSVVYPDRNFQLDSTGTVTPVVISGTEPILSWQTSGTIPSEFSFNSLTGILTYDTNGSVGSSGSFQIRAANPAGFSDWYDFDWSIDSGQGISEYTNNLIPYAALRLSPASYPSSKVFSKLGFFGKTTNIFDGTIIEDSNYPIYVTSNGDGTFDYLLLPNGYTYWLLFQNSITDPHDLIDGYSSDLTYSLGVEFVCPVSDNFTLDGVIYPSDQTDVHYLTTTKYIEVGTDSSFDGFMCSDVSWSCGFKLEQFMPLDGLGRIMFSRFPRNWFGFYLAHSSNRTRGIYGNGSNRSNQGNSSYPSTGLAAGTRLHFTYDTSDLNIYADGVLLFSLNVSDTFDPSSSANGLEIRFGMSPESDADQNSITHFHGFYQGLISDLWISNNSVEDGSLGIPSDCSHSWSLNETTGNTFAASKGGIDIFGRSVS